MNTWGPYLFATVSTTSMVKYKVSDFNSVSQDTSAQHTVVNVVQVFLAVVVPRQQWSSLSPRLSALLILI